jgi:YidC/Oxa1 family membrane protein insertase
MSDQNRLLIAAALMAVVLFVSWQFMGKQSSNQQDAQDNLQTASTLQTTAEYTEPTPRDTVSGDVPGDTLTGETDEVIIPAERIITVVVRENDQDIAVAELSSYTGSITSWRLSQYEDMPGTGSDSPVDFNGAQWFNNDGYYTTESMDTVIVDQDIETVIFEDPEGTKYIEYTFTPGFYGFGIRRTGFDQILVLNSGVLPVTETNVATGKYFKAHWNSEKVRSRDTDDIDANDQVGNVEWIASRSKYFAVILLPRSFERAYGYIYSGPEDVSPSVGIQDNNVLVYAGPLDYGRLRQLGSDTHRMVDFGWPIIRDIGRLLFWFCNSVLSFAGNWGLRIILLSIALKIVLLPISNKSFKSMAKLKQVQPRMKELQDKYRNDPKALQSAMQKLYREEGVNPLGGCLPLLMQMPVFFAMYRVLANSVQLRGAEFVLWIKDLSNPEILINFSSPILGLQGIGLLAVLMGVSMFLQQKMTSADQSQKGMMYILPIFMTYLFMRFPAGLTLYWFMNNVLTIGQQMMINRSLEAESKS